jgi:PilZ domain-containing protein
VERRKSQRYSVRAEIEIRELGSRAPSRGNTTDLSLSGCYVATIFPLPMGSTLDFTLWIDNGSIRGRGSVKTCHPGVGMGIKFSSLTNEEACRLKSYVHAAILSAPEERFQPYIR